VDAQEGTLTSTGSPAQPAESRAEAFDLITMGRSGVDMYPLQVGLGLEDVRSFGKFLGGTAVNVAVAAAALGHRAACVTGVGDDPFGRFVRRELRALSVSDQFVAVVPGVKTPLAFCEIFPPDNFPLYFYRAPTAPDLRLSPDDMPVADVAAARIFWVTLTGLSAEPSRAAHRTALAARGRRAFTVVDLDYRPMFWESEADARVAAQTLLAEATVAIGNREECRIAVGETEPERAADALLEMGLDVAVVKQGPLGTLAKTRHERVEVPPTRVATLNGLGAGDAFGGAFCHGLLSGWPLERAIRAASIAGAIVASRLECATAMPREHEIMALLGPEANPADARTVRSTASTLGVEL
jgi:5-dehydro-2-deoxygluconokinase